MYKINFIDANLKYEENMIIVLDWAKSLTNSSSARQYKLTLMLGSTSREFCSTQWTSDLARICCVATLLLCSYPLGHEPDELNDPFTR
jgi:hypothetical protein